MKKNGCKVMVSMVALCIMALLSGEALSETSDTGDCTDYIDITLLPLPISVSGSTVDAANNYGPYEEQPSCWQGIFLADLSGGGPDITFKWTAPMDTSYSISLLNSEYDTGLEIYDFTCPNEPVYPDDFICGNEDYQNYRSKLAIYFTAGQTVLIVVDGYGSQSGNYQLDIDYTPFPGENCHSYIDLDNMMTPVSITGSTICAMNNFSLTSGEPPCWQGDFNSTCADGPDIVYRWVAPYFANYGFSVEANDFNPTILLYEFTCPQEPVYPDDFICGNDFYADNNAYLYDISLHQGQEVLIVVDGQAGYGGNYRLNISMLSGGGDRFVCPENTLYGQTASTVSDPWAVLLSDRHEGPTIVYDNIPNVHGTVTGINFMGFDGIWENNMFMEAEADSMSFWVRFYSDGNDGMPGPVIDSRVIIPEKMVVGPYMYIMLNNYRATFDESFVVDGGWISIQGLSIEEPVDCVFLWLNSQDGDDICYQGETGPVYLLDYSMNFCLLDSTGSPISYDGGKLPSNVVLGQNYPNPFNSRTGIEFSLPKQSKATLDLFDIGGRKIATLFDEISGPGNYNVIWDASDVVSGIYFYRLVAGNELIIKKMILIK